MQPEPSTTETPTSKTGPEGAPATLEAEVITAESGLTETNTSKTGGEVAAPTQAIQEPRPAQQQLVPKPLPPAQRQVRGPRR
jgi:hypothetical protein